MSQNTATSVAGPNVPKNPRKTKEDAGQKVYYVPDAMQRLWPGFAVIIQVGASPEDAAARINTRFKQIGLMSHPTIQPRQLREVSDFAIISDRVNTTPYNDI